MKITIRRTSSGKLSAYVPKKDLESDIVEMERADLWGGWVELDNGWRFDLPEMAVETPLPITVTARRIEA